MKRLTDDVLVAITLAVCVITLWTGPVVAVALFFLVGPAVVVWFLLERSADEPGERSQDGSAPAERPRRRHDPPQPA